jgi:hypothetical protein
VRLVVIAPVAAALVLAACGSSAPTSSAPPGGGGLSSGSGLQHGIGITVDGADQDGPTVAPGSTSTVTVTLRPGTYTCYCPVPSHRQPA